MSCFEVWFEVAVWQSTDNTPSASPPQHLSIRGCVCVCACVIINPRRACAARVTVLGLSVCVCVCVDDYSHSVGNETAYERYQRVQCHAGLIFKMAIFV